MNLPPITGPQPEPREWHRGKFRGYVLHGYEDLAPESLPWQNAGDKKPLPDGIELAKRGRSRLVLASNFKDEKLYFKRMKPRLLRQRISNLFRGSKSWREWKAGRELLEKGVLTPEPVLYAKSPDGTTFIVTRGLPPAWEPLDHWLNRNGPDGEMLDQVAQYTAWIHGLLVYHHDYRSDHIYPVVPIEKNAAIGERFCLIDLDGTRIGKPITNAKRDEALFELFLSVMRYEFTPELAGRFISVYEDSAGVKIENSQTLFDRAHRSLSVYREAKANRRKG